MSCIQGTRQKGDFKLHPPLFEQSLACFKGGRW